MGEFWNIFPKYFPIFVQKYFELKNLKSPDSGDCWGLFRLCRCFRWPYILRIILKLWTVPVWFYSYFVEFRLFFLSVQLLTEDIDASNHEHYQLLPVLKSTNQRDVFEHPIRARIQSANQRLWFRAWVRFQNEPVW